jgi:hypothetical protein
MSPAHRLQHHTTSHESTARNIQTQVQSKRTRAGEEITKFMERDRHHPIGSEKRLFHAITVVHVNVDIQLISTQSWSRINDSA